MSNSQEILDNISNQPGILGTIIMLTSSGVTVKTTLKDSEASQYSALVADFLKKSYEATQSINPDDKVQCIRIRSFKNELFIFPDKVFTLVIIQDAMAA